MRTVSSRFYRITVVNFLVRNSGRDPQMLLLAAQTPKEVKTDLAGFLFWRAWPAQIGPRRTFSEEISCPTRSTWPTCKPTLAGRKLSRPAPPVPSTRVPPPPGFLQGKAPSRSFPPPPPGPSETHQRHHIRSRKGPLSPSPPAPSRSRYPSVRRFLSSCSSIGEREH